jgi:hypothetical protein
LPENPSFHHQGASIINKFRFSITAMLAMTGYAAFTFVALPSGTIFWASFAFTGALGLLTLALMGVLYSEAATRAFWVGFVLVGFGYYSIVFAPMLDRQIGSRLATTKLLAYLQSNIQRTPPSTKPWFGRTSAEVTLSLDYVDLVRRMSSGPVLYAAPQWDPFQQTGHSLLTIPLAIIGGVICRHLYLEPRSKNNNSSNASRTETMLDKNA